MVRELWRYGKSVSQYVPKEINKLLWIEVSKNG
jgi:phosphopantetheine adenylyltransferase